MPNQAIRVDKSKKMSHFNQLKISDIRPTTEDATTVAFEIPSELKSAYHFKPGQYLTLRFNINGEDVRRSYSICSSPLEEELHVGIKRVKKGLVSNYIPDNLKVGDVVDVMPPNGLFFADVKPNNYKTYYLFAGGSGITPVLSILKTVLSTEPNSYVYMLYGNQHQNSVMFLDEIEKLYEAYPERFFLVHCLSRPKGMFSKKNEIEFRKGRADSEAIKWFLNEYQPYAQDCEYYICGPAPMIESAVQTLKSIDVPENRIFIERFSAGEEDNSQQGVAASLTAMLEGEKIAVQIEAGQTVLRSLLDEGYNPPYSCEGGVCSTCVCKLKKGKVHMKNNVALSDDEVKDGYILSCQSLPLTAEIEIDYQS